MAANGVDGDPTLSLWGEFLDEVFENEEIGAGYEVSSRTAANTGLSASRVVRELSEVDSDEFEEIGDAVEQPFTNHNDRTFPKKPSNCGDFVGRKQTKRVVWVNNVQADQLSKSENRNCILHFDLIIQLKAIVSSMKSCFNVDHIESPTLPRVSQFLFQYTLSSYFARFIDIRACHRVICAVHLVLCVLDYV
ncbi:hypothetical protein GQ600_16479 [Phytophthora cactorum]|nr:hypothetical protein GQ600_16479 [Phytophthora cactorum]